MRNISTDDRFNFDGKLNGFCKITLLLLNDTDKRHIISTKSRGLSQTPQDIMEEYNGCSVPLYTAYPFIQNERLGPPLTHDPTLSEISTKT